MPDLFANAGLTGVVLIDVAIGLIFAVLTFSLIASALQEAIAGMLNYRGEHLRRGIVRLIRDEQLSGALLDHPLIAGLKGPKNRVQRILQILFIWGDAAREPDRLPSSIPKGTFARALIDTLVARRHALEQTVSNAADGAQRAADLLAVEIDRLTLDARLKSRLKEIVGRVDFSQLDDHLMDAVNGTLDEAKARAAQALQGAVEQLERELAEWFDTAMDRVTGWYVRRAKTMLFAIGFVMAAGLGFDFIGYANQLVRDDALRSAVVARAQATAATGEVGAFALDAPQVNMLAAEASTKPEAEWTEDERSAVNALARYAGEDNVLSDTEAARADADLRTAFALVDTRTQEAIAAVQQLEGGLDASFWAATVPDKLRMVLGWFLIGIGCTLGGQFWFDLLQSLLKVRASASGLNTDREKRGRDGRGAG